MAPSGATSVTTPPTRGTRATTPPPHHPAQRLGLPRGRHLARPTTYSGPSNAHRLLPETTQTAGGGGDVRRKEGDCLYCHASHRGPNTYDALRAAYRPSSSTLASDQAQGTYAPACFACHGGVAPSGFATAPVDIKQFVTRTPRGRSQDRDLRRRPACRLAPAVLRVPQPSRVQSRQRVADLGHARRGLDTGTADGVRRFCLSCHTTSGTRVGWDSAAATYTAVASSETVVGYPGPPACSLCRRWSGTLRQIRPRATGVTAAATPLAATTSTIPLEAQYPATSRPPPLTASVRAVTTTPRISARCTPCTLAREASARSSRPPVHCATRTLRSTSVPPLT